MKMRTYEFNDNLDFKKIQTLLVQHQDVVTFKNFFDKKLLKTFRQELINWKENTPEHNPQDPYPLTKRNLHLAVKNDVHMINQQHIDYHELYTKLDVYNYRIGDYLAPEIQAHIPLINSIAPKTLSVFHKILDNPHVKHGTKSGKNLFFEIPHYKTNSGFIEEHTHQANFDFGQTFNMVILLSEKGEDFQKGGLHFKKSNVEIDTSDSFEMGDAVLFRNDTIHWVDKVISTDLKHQQNDRGRWTLCLFYY